MSLIIDNRERDLLQLVNCDVEKKNLDVGDIIVLYNDSPEVLIERKTIKDLAQSIKDGRYKEQKLRILNSEFKNKQIIYLLEGSIPASGKIQGIPVSTLISTIVKMTIRDKIHVIRSKDVEETFRIVMKIKDKIGECLKESSKLISHNEIKDDDSNVPDSSNDAKEETLIDNTMKNYASTIQIQKKKNINPQICFIAQLSQIPGIALETATALAEHFGNMTKLCENIAEKNTSAFESIRIGKRSSKLSKKLAESICSFLS